MQTHHMYVDDQYAWNHSQDMRGGLIENKNYSRIGFLPIKHNEEGNDIHK